MLIRAHRQEGLSRAYIHAIAARCGLGSSVREFDYGIDLTLHAIREQEGRYIESGFRLDIQAKATTTAVATTAHIVYDMEVRTYDVLRDAECVVPRILVLMVMPGEEVAWTEQDEDRLLIRRCAYWLSLRGHPATANTATIRVAVPRSNVFAVEALQGLMDKVRRREPL